MSVFSILRAPILLIISVLLALFVKLDAFHFVYLVGAVGGILLMNGVDRRLAVCYFIFIFLNSLLEPFLYEYAYYGVPILCSLMMFSAMNLSGVSKVNSKFTFICGALVVDTLINVLAIIEFGTRENFVYMVYPTACHFINLMMLSEILIGGWNGTKVSGFSIRFNRSRWHNKDGDKVRKRKTI